MSCLERCPASGLVNGDFQSCKGSGCRPDLSPLEARLDAEEPATRDSVVANNAMAPCTSSANSNQRAASSP
jgi:hypothetical protein